MEEGWDDVDGAPCVAAAGESENMRPAAAELLVVVVVADRGGWCTLVDAEDVFAALEEGGYGGLLSYSAACCIIAAMLYDAGVPPAAEEVAALVVVNADESLVEGECVSLDGGAELKTADAGCSGDLGLFEGEAVAAIESIL